MFEMGFTVVVADHVTDLSVSVSTDTHDTTTKNNAGYRALLPGKVFDRPLHLCW